MLPPKCIEARAGLPFSCQSRETYRDRSSEAATFVTPVHRLSERPCFTGGRGWVASFFPNLPCKLLKRLYICARSENLKWFFGARILVPDRFFTNSHFRYQGSDCEPRLSFSIVPIQKVKACKVHLEISAVKTMRYWTETGMRYRHISGVRVQTVTQTVSIKTGTIFTPLSYA